MADRIPMASTPAVTIYKAKLVVLGNMGVGKTAIAHRYAKGEFDPIHTHTIAASFVQQTLTIDNVEIHFQIWDTAGQEKYMALIPMYLRGAKVALVVFDVTDNESFENVENWLSALDAYTECFYKVLVANKVDLRAKVSMLRAEIFAAEHGMGFIQTSAKTGLNIDKLFSEIGKVIVNKLKMEASEDSLDKDILSSVVYHPSPIKKPKCCS